MKKKVTRCNDCFFIHFDFDPDSVGDDTIVQCKLISQMSNGNTKHNSTIDVYDSYNSSARGDYEPLDNCPLRDEKLEIELEL